MGHNIRGIKVLIREAQMGDALGLAKVTVDSWKTTYIDIVPAEFLASLSYEENIPVWQDRLSDSASTWSYYVAEDEKEKIIGFAGGGTERKGNSVYTAELGFIYLLKAYQRNGLGRQLITILANRLIQQGHHSMLVWSLAANPNRVFYEVVGGKLIGTRNTNIGGTNLVEVGYGWEDLSIFQCQNSKPNNQFDSK